MRPPVDLHSHSTFSDGADTVEEICTLAVKSGVQFLSLSDHDTTVGLPVMRAAVDAQNDRGNTLTLIPAIELSSGDSGMLHILGYGIEPAAEPLQSELKALRKKRADRSVETIRLLNRLLQTQLLPESMLHGGNEQSTLGRMHIARLLTEKKIVRSTDEAFRKYLGAGMPAYLPLKHITAEDAIRVLLQSGAVPVMAHPMRISRERAVLENLITHLKDCGLAGLEVYHPSASHGDVKWLYRLAQRNDLLVTGGSDYHGDRGMHSRLGRYPSGWQTWAQDLDALQMAIDAAAHSQTRGED